MKTTTTKTSRKTARPTQKAAKAAFISRWRQEMRALLRDQSQIMGW